MKKFAIVAITLACALAYMLGHADGVRHALSASTYVLTEFCEEEAPNDFLLAIELDGNLYENYGFIG